LRSIDLSGNSLRRLTERLLQGLQLTLVELKLADNLLGDTLNPIFSTSELHGLNHLQVLDLSGNVIKAIEEGILEGCDNLQVSYERTARLYNTPFLTVCFQELFLGRNSLISIPSSSLNGPKSLRVLSLATNRIGNPFGARKRLFPNGLLSGIVKNGAFQAQPNLEQIDLGNNLIHTIEGGAFKRLDRLKSLKLAHNRLTRFNSDVFQGADSLQTLDLSENFINEFPTVALKAFKDLKYLNLSSNLIQVGF
jgi:Leucine-rich repeat (LRR) protein